MTQSLRQILQNSPPEDLPAFAQAIHIPTLDQINPDTVNSIFTNAIPIAFARNHHLIAIDAPDNHITIVFANALGLQRIDNVARIMTQRSSPAPKISIARGEADQILSAINHAYQNSESQAQQAIDNLQPTSADHQPMSREDLLDVANRAPVVKTVNLLLLEAIKQQASDIHIQPGDEQLTVRFRCDGVLFDAYELPISLSDEVSSRIKVMARMDIAEKRLPQDGRASVQIGERDVDLRISCIPSSFGQRLVIRLLDKSNKLLNLPQLGMDQTTLDHYRNLIHLEHGLVLVTGPTGSGKSTTLYASLGEINAKEKNILTLEDPIEYQLQGVSQTQVSEKRGMTFADGLRSVLRQDPDVIMVGEIRDKETAAMAIQSSLTGHLVFSTLHTNDAASAVTRLLDLGVEPFLVSSSLVGVLAQRLVRRVCQNCVQHAQPTAEQITGLNIEPSTNFTNAQHGQGCPACHHSGYRGRIGLYELLTVNETMRQAISQNATASQIRDMALEQNMQTLRTQGVALALAGQTDFEEALRVTMRMDS